MLRRFGVILGAAATVVSLCTIATAQSYRRGIGPERVAQAMPNYVTWYVTSSPWPTPITDADAGIGGAFGVANLYNVGGLVVPSGLAMLGSGGCYFICFGAPGQSSHHVLAYGNDFQTPGPNNTGSFTSQGAPDDCEPSHCPGGVPNQIFSVSLTASAPPNNGYIVAVDGNGNLGVANNIVAGAAIAAGAGDANPGVTSGITSLAGGVRPNGASGGYAPEAFPQGLATEHPQILSGTCVGIATPAVCTFPNFFAFADTSYNCAVTALGSTGIADSYQKTSTTSITIYSATVATFSYICMR